MQYFSSYKWFSAWFQEFECIKISKIHFPLELKLIISRSLTEMEESKRKLDWANSAPTYPQTGHHSRHRFWSGIFKNIITHYYMNFSTSIYSVYISPRKMVYPQTPNT